MSEPLLPYEWPGSYFIGEEEIDAVQQVLLARSPFRFYGHDLQRFAEQVEGAYRDRLGRRYALAVNSGTAALSVAMSALDIGPGDEVLIPGYLWVSCIAAVVRAGAIPRLVEIDESFCMDPADLERKIGPHSKAVLIVHMSGACGDLDRLLHVSRAHNLLVLEDVAQANGASFQGRPLGSFGDMAIFSFQLNKNMTSGEGGMVVCDDENLFQRAWACHDLGYPRDADGRLIFDNPDVQLWGQGSRMSELTAAMATVQVRKLDTIVSAMRRLSRRLYAGLAGIGGARPRQLVDPNGDSGAFVLLIWPDAETCRRMVAATQEAGVRTGPKGINNVVVGDSWGLHLYYNNVSLVHRRGVNASGYPWTHPANTFAASYGYGKGALPHADDLFVRTSLLEVPPILSEDTCDRIIAIFRQCAADLGLPQG
ncbi:MAG: DegT/DnrJ/EryC1/StrS family aminotransferase [Anaerolineae bacterium]